MTSPSLSRTRKRISIRGVVQGVGFRPFVYNLARSLQLAGFILNSSSGVTIESNVWSGIEEFLHRLRTSPPPLAQIMEITLKEVSLQHASDFSIQASQEKEDAFSLISPDVATATIAGASLAIRRTAVTDMRLSCSAGDDEKPFDCLPCPAGWPSNDGLMQRFQLLVRPDVQPGGRYVERHQMRWRRKPIGV